MQVLYSHGDSVVWGAELENKQTERFSYHLSNKLGAIDCNNASAGVSNDYIYRQTMRDVSNWLGNGVVWSEDTGWVTASKLTIVIGWTAPTRFEWWDGNKYQQERLWTGYDKWGESDRDKTTEDVFVLNQTMDIPSYIRTFNHIISLSAFLEKNNIPYYFFNSFYEYQIPLEPIEKIDKFGKSDFQSGLNSLWDFIPQSMKDETMFEYLNKSGGDFLSRKHPSAKSHKMWANNLLKKIKI